MQQWIEDTQGRLINVDKIAAIEPYPTENEVKNYYGKKTYNIVMYVGEGATFHTFFYKIDVSEEHVKNYMINLKKFLKSDNKILEQTYNM